MTSTLLDQEKQHLASLLEAIQRCVYFLDAAGAVWCSPREFVSYCQLTLNIAPSGSDFSEEFAAIVGREEMGKAAK